MFTKITTRVVLPFLLLGGWVWYTVYYNEILTSFFVSFFLVVLSLICGISIAIYITGLFLPGFFDFKFWSKSSYTELINQPLKNGWSIYKSGNIFRVFYYLFIPVFIYIILAGWFVLNKKNIDFQLEKYGVETRGYITHYDVSFKDNIKKRYIAVEYSLKNGEKQNNYIRVINKYSIMDSVTIRYSSKRPSIYKVVEEKE